jgi:hypothetical protein
MGEGLGANDQGGGQDSERFSGRSPCLDVLALSVICHGKSSGEGIAPFSRRFR